MQERHGLRSGATGRLLLVLSGRELPASTDARISSMSERPWYDGRRLGYDGRRWHAGDSRDVEARTVIADLEAERVAARAQVRGNGGCGPRRAWSRFCSASRQQ